MGDSSSGVVGEEPGGRAARPAVMNAPTTALLGILIILAGCGAAGASPTPSGPGDSQPEGGSPLGAWQLVTGSADGAALPLEETHPVTAVVEESRIGGTSACNGYGGRLVATGDGIRIEELSWTAMACAPESVMDVEAGYLAALGRVTAIGVEGDQLLLRGPGVELRFDRLPEPAVSELIGTTWQLETLVVGDVAQAAAGESADLVLSEDGTLRGSTGCRAFDGRWIETPERIQVTELAMTDQACPEELVLQDSHVVSVIGDGFFPSVEGDLLTLVDPGSIGLVYRASE
jgi:heat shock protein HslJ